MTSIRLLKSAAGMFRGFTVTGHAGRDAYGKDIACAAVSILAINTVNALSSFTDDRIAVSRNRKKGLIECMFEDVPSADATLLMRTFELGVTEIAKQYPEVSCQIEEKG